VNEPLPPGAEAYDCDGDGFVGEEESMITTGNQDPCGSGWPADLTGDNKLNIADFTSFIFPLGPDDGHGVFAYFGQAVRHQVPPLLIHARRIRHGMQSLSPT
jgi:hypothetical protein